MLGFFFFFKPFVKRSAKIGAERMSGKLKQFWERIENGTACCGVVFKQRRALYKYII
ncbi:hypothetical protein Nmel_013608 [Mimus melanotis]